MSDEDEEGTTIEKTKEQKDRELLYQFLPPDCGGSLKMNPDNVKPNYRESEPTRIIPPDECFRPCPKIITREQWGARLPTSPPKQTMYRVRAAVFKQSDTHNCSDLFTCVHNVKLLQMYQMDYLHYSDIAYSFLIGEDGNVYEGRGWGVSCEKANGFMGIGFLGYYTDEGVTRPSDDMLQLAYDLIMCGVRKGFIANPFRHWGGGMTPLQMMREYVENEEDVDYKTKVEDPGIY